MHCQKQLHDNVNSNVFLISTLLLLSKVYFRSPDTMSSVVLHNTRYSNGQKDFPFCIGSMDGTINYLSTTHTSMNITQSSGLEL